MYCLQPKPENKSKRSLGIGSDAEILFDETKILVLLNLHISNFHFVNDCNACKEWLCIL